MNPKLRYKIKCFMLYEILEPFESKFKFTANVCLWTAITISVVFRLLPLFVGAVILKIILHAILEWRAGKFVYFVRMRNNKIRGYKEAIQKMRKEKMLGQMFNKKFIIFGISQTAN